MFGSDIVSMTSTKTGLQEANRQIDSRESQRWVWNFPRVSIH